MDEMFSREVSIVTASTEAHRSRDAHSSDRVTSLLRAPTFLRGKTEIFAETAQLERGVTSSLREEDDVGDNGSRSTDTEESDYDTDLEDVTVSHTPYDEHGVRTYSHTCRKLGLTPIRQIISGLKKTELAFRNRILSPSEMLAICNGLLDNRSVQSLCFDGNKFGDKGAIYISYLLSESDCLITTLILQGNNIRSAGMEHLTSTITPNKVLTKLDLSGNNIGDEDVDGFVQLLKNNRTLTSLNLSHNAIGDKGARSLGVGLALNESLRVFDVSWNQIREAGGVAICYSLKDNILLKTFNITMNGISNGGAFAMGESLRHNSSLVDVDISYNRVHDEGVERLIKGLKKNDTLRTLKMQCNPLTCIGAMKLLTAIRANPNSALELVDLSTVPLYIKGLDAIDDIRERCSNFKFLYATLVHAEREEKPKAMGINLKEPLQVLREYMDSKGMRLVDFFRQFDADGGGSISKAEFKRGMKYIEAPLTEAQLEELIDGLDKTGNGEVNLRELVAGDREYKRKQLRKKLANAGNY